MLSCTYLLVILYLQILVWYMVTYLWVMCIYFLFAAGLVTRYIIFTNPSAWAGYDTRSIFKRSLTDLNSEFSFSSTSCLLKAEELVCLTIYP